MLTYLAYFLAAVLAIYAWVNWFDSLCGMIILMAIIDHPSMPSMTMGVQGLNPWNLVFLNVFLSWWTHRKMEGLKWDLSQNVTFMLLAYLAVFFVAFLRMLFDRGALEKYGYGPVDLVSEHLINTLKWVIPGLLIFDGCRTRKRLRKVAIAICLMYLLMAIQVVRYMPWSALTGGGSMKIREQLVDDMGLGPGLLGKVFAGGAWAALAVTMLFKGKKIHLLVLYGTFAGITLAQLFVGSRAGFAAWFAVGGLMCVLRWKRSLLIAPIVPLILFYMSPAAFDRITMGFGGSDVTGESEYLMTSGRNLIWPHVIKKIGQSPMIGHGKEAMRRTGLTNKLYNTAGEGEAVAHAHNAYLDLSLESGLVGLTVVMIFFGMMVYSAAQLFRMRDPISACTGGLVLAIVVSHLVAGLGSQSFFPREGDFGMWCVIGMGLRVMCERAKLAARATARLAARNRSFTPRSRRAVPAREYSSGT